MMVEKGEGWGNRGGWKPRNQPRFEWVASAVLMRSGVFSLFLIMLKGVDPRAHCLTAVEDHSGRPKWVNSAPKEVLVIVAKRWLVGCGKDGSLGLRRSAGRETSSRFGYYWILRTPSF